MSTQFLGSDSFTVIPDVNGNPLTVSTGGTIPSVTGGAGAPSGTPTYGTGSLYVDTTNYQLYVYQSSAWKLVGTSNIVTSISTATTPPAVANSSYVYLVSGTTTITMPTAVGNKCTYTVKNISGLTTINLFGAEQIDGSYSIFINVPYTSLTFVSNGTGWSII